MGYAHFVYPSRGVVRPKNTKHENRKWAFHDYSFCATCLGCYALVRPTVLRLEPFLPKLRSRSRRYCTFPPKKEFDQVPSSTGIVSTKALEGTMSLIFTQISYVEHPVYRSNPLPLPRWVVMHHGEVRSVKNCPGKYLPGQNGGCLISNGASPTGFLKTQDTHDPRFCNQILI